MKKAVQVFGEVLAKKVDRRRVEVRSYEVRSQKSERRVAETAAISLRLGGLSFCSGETDDAQDTETRGAGRRRARRRRASG